MGDHSSLLRLVPDVAVCRRRRPVLCRARPRGRSKFFDQDHARPDAMAGRHDRRHDAAGDRPNRKKLQETPWLYYLKSYTKPGASTVYVNVLDNTPKNAIPDIWYQVRKKIADIKGTLPQGVVGPYFNDEFGDVFGIIYAFTADGFTHRELRDYVEQIRTDIFTVKNAAKIQLLGAQSRKFYLEF